MFKVRLWGSGEWALNLAAQLEEFEAVKGMPGGWVWGSPTAESLPLTACR